jgi:hypothetical protein
LLIALLSGSAEGQTGTLTLDATSYLSLDEARNLAIPQGASIRFRFGPAAADGSIPIRVEPADLVIPPIRVEEDVTIQYSLASAATGSMRRVGGAAQIELLVALVASLREGPSVRTYELRFTTGRAQATNVSGTEVVQVDGVPVADGSYVELVGAATNRPDAFPAPGEAVYAVLSGRFDWLPVLP